jgi:hypothetical protein
VGTNSLSTNVVSGTNVVNGTFVMTGIRGGVNKLAFKRVSFDTLLGQTFKPFTNTYTETVLTNSRAVQQKLSRAVTQPDLLFVSADCGLVLGLVPLQALRTVTANWQNNDLLNGADGTGGDQFGGPGVVTPQVQITFSDQLPYWLNNSPDFLRGDNDPPASAVWGSFDENTEVPVIYPLWLNLTPEDLQRLSR